MKFSAFIKLMISISALLACASYAQTKQAYTMKDLQVLANQQAWRELAEHLGDITPTGRNKEWEQLAEKAALGVLQDSDSKLKPDAGIVASDDLLSRFPGLKKSKEFMTKRAEIGLQSFARCFSYQYYFAECNKQLKKFIASDAGNLDLAFKAGKLVRLNMSHWSALPYFRSGLAQKNESRNCQDEDVQLAVLSGLRLPKDYRESIEDAGTIAAQLCWNELKSALLAELKSGNSYFKENSCGFLKTKAPTEANQACK